MRLNKSFLSIIFLAVCGMAVPAFADVIYAVTVDTSSLSGNAGYIDLQFNPSSFTTQSANAAVTTFSTDGTLDAFGDDPFDGLIGDVTGTLPGTVSFDNGTSTNDYTQGMTFGTTISFHVDLSGPAIDLPNGEDGGSFLLTFYDPSGNPLLTNSPNGAAFEADINPDGSTTATAYPNADGGPSVGTFVGPTEVSAIPEPSMVLLLAGGLAAIAAILRRP
jgi:PEP-CTERM motif